jgi:hypothetical protein
MSENHWENFAVGTLISERTPHIYGPAAGCKRNDSEDHAVCFNLSGLWLEPAPRAIMEIRIAEVRERKRGRRNNGLPAHEIWPRTWPSRPWI